MKRRCYHNDLDAHNLFLASADVAGSPRAAATTLARLGMLDGLNPN
jgi:hypothetical protein